MTVKRVYGCKVSPLVWSIFFGQKADLTSGRDCTPNNIMRKRHACVPTLHIIRRKDRPFLKVNPIRSRDICFIPTKLVTDEPKAGQGFVQEQARRSGYDESRKTHIQSSFKSFGNCLHASTIQCGRGMRRQTLPEHATPTLDEASWLNC